MALRYLTGVWMTGTLRGKVHKFDLDEGLPVHSHADGRGMHITVVLSGSFLCVGNPEIEGEIMKVGDVLDWTASEPHGFRALEANSSFLQIAKQ